VWSGVISPDWIVVSRTRTRSFSKITLCWSGAAIGPSSSPGHGHGAVS
jgi:hypothetical protein